MYIRLLSHNLANVNVYFCKSNKHVWKYAYNCIYMFVHIMYDSVINDKQELRCKKQNKKKLDCTQNKNNNTI